MVPSGAAETIDGTRPSPLLSRMTKDEILDLAAYVLSGGNPENAMFRESR